MKGDPSSITVHHNLQALEPDQEISTIPTIINGVITKSDVASSDSSTDAIKHHIDNLLTIIKDQNMCINSTNTTHKIVLNGDSHIKGFATALQSVLNSE
jgi:hypothetical protein